MIFQGYTIGWLSGPSCPAKPVARGTAYRATEVIGGMPHEGGGLRWGFLLPAVRYPKATRSSYGRNKVDPGQKEDLVPAPKMNVNYRIWKCVSRFIIVEPRA